MPVIALLFAGCGSDDDDDAGDRTDIALSFRAMVGSQDADCSTVYSALGSVGSSAQLADARLFVSGIELRNDSGTWVGLTLTDSDWQSSGVALLDFEDRTGACADSGTPETNTTVYGNLPKGTYDRVRFTAGIPFELNHVDPALAATPFNVSGMFWTWQGGFKFVRVDWLVAGAEASDPVSRWNLHVGSTGCVSSAATEAPTEPCSRPNAATIEVGPMSFDTGAIKVDLGALVAGADLSTNIVDTPPGCMSSPTEAADCSPAFSALGLSFDAGSCADDCTGQSVFTVAP